MSLVEAVRDGLWLAALLVAPLAAAAAAAALAIGWLGGRIGLRDPAVLMIARAVAVALTLMALGERMAGRLVERTEALWAGLGGGPGR